MTYAIQIIYNQETFFGYRNSKGEWTPSLSTPEGSTSFKTESGAWRAIMKSDSSLASASGSACWYDLLQKKGYEVNVVSVIQAEKIVQSKEVKLIAKLDLDILAIQWQLTNLQAQRDLINGSKKQRSLKAQVYINRHIVGANKKATTANNLVDDAAISINTSLGVIYAKRIEFTAGATLIQNAADARCSGATIWVETTFESLIIDGVPADRAMFNKD